MKKIFKRVVSTLTALAMSASVCLSDFNGKKTDNIVSAAMADCKFDFGNGGVQNGFIGVSANQAYDSSKGYGFNTPAYMSDTNASGSGELSDAVVFKSTDRSNTFKVDLEPGLYKITVHLGNTTRASVVAEDVLQLINLTGNNATDSFTIPVTDGQLSLMVTEGKANTVFSLSSLVIDKISDDTTLPQTVWLCGDSTVCNYYPLETSQRVGWGQVLGEFISSDLMIRNLAASGQYAAGFVNAGQFDPVLKYGKKGDYYIISIGINDTNYSNREEYYNVVSDMTKKAKEKGITVILVKQQGRSDDISRDQLLTGRYYGEQLDKIGQEQNVQVVDLFNLAQNHFLSIGQTATTALYDNDKVHFNRSGARVLAKLVSSDISFSSSGQDQTQPPVTDVTPPASESEFDGLYMIKNVNSGLYLDVDTTDSNVYQMPATAPGATNQWNVVSAGDGYYYLYSTTAEDKVLDVAGKKTVNGTNILIYNYKGADNQQFKLLKNRDGSYKICTKITANASCIEIVDGLTTAGANVQQYEINGFNCQDWIFEKVTGQQNPVTPSVKLIYGDLDSNEIVDLTDLTIYSLYLLGDRQLSDEILPAADVDGSGSVDIADLATMKQYVSKENVGLIGTEVKNNQNTDPPAQVPDTPVQENPTVYIAGDSTVQSYKASAAPQQGWGYYIGNYFNSNVTVANHAIAGRSSKSFYDNGRLDTILGQIKSGDYLFVQFAINDAGYTNADRYAPVCGSVTNPTDGSYEFYINKYVEGALSKGATPVLVTTVIGLKAYSGGKFVNSYENYCQAMKNIAAHYKIPCIDLNSLMVSHYNSIGYDAAKLYHLHGVVSGSTDMTHFSEQGADAVAKIVANAVKNLGIPLSKYVK